MDYFHQTRSERDGEAGQARRKARARMIRRQNNRTNPGALEKAS